MQGFAEFEFDLPRALLRELIALLDDMDVGRLDEQTTAAIPDVQGVYQLFHEDQLVYIGKTDAQAGLRNRLSRHVHRIAHRPRLSGGVHFKAVRILVFTAMDLETQLIAHYRAQGSVPWNGSGFGSNDPGRNRETTNQDPDGFDASYPIDIDLPVDLLPPGPTRIADALARMKAALPYTLRYETQRNAKGKAQRGNPHPDIAASTVAIPAPPQTVRQLMRSIKDALGPDWQATVFPSHVILYKENRAYQHGQII